jgi:hypothetical protein
MVSSSLNLRNEAKWEIPLDMVATHFDRAKGVFHPRLDLRSAYATVFLVEYIALLLASWFWFNQLGYDVRGTTIGLTVIAGYAGVLLWSVAREHPSDIYGIALFALALGAASAG